VGERIHTKGLGDTAQPFEAVVLPAGAAGLALLFRYGAVVFFHTTEAEQKTLLATLHERIEHPLRKTESEEATLVIGGKNGEGVTPPGLALADGSLPRLLLVATVLARSVCLAYYESTVSDVFDLIEPLARKLDQPPGGGRRLRALLSHIGGTLLVQQRLIARVEIQDKPDLLWERPELEGLYLRLETEYELTQRNLVLERKLALIAHTAQTALDLVQNRSMLRVEWYIVLLIVFEVLLTLYQLWWKA
jgi:uncharacterized Rmd1/YagE family protein